MASSWRALLTTAIIAAVVALAYTILSFQYSWGTMAQPGTGFMPFWVGVLFIISALGVAWEAWSGRSEEPLDWPGRDGWLRVAGVAAVAIGYVVLLGYIGHGLSGSLAALALMSLMGARPWLAIPLALLMGFGSAFLFINILGVRLPPGLLFQ